MEDIAAIAAGLTESERSALLNAKRRGYGWPAENLYQQGSEATSQKLAKKKLTHRMSLTPLGQQVRSYLMDNQDG